MTFHRYRESWGGEKGTQGLGEVKKKRKKGRYAFTGTVGNSPEKPPFRQTSRDDTTGIEQQPGVGDQVTWRRR